MLAQEELLASLMTEDPFCAIEGVKTLESKLHHERLAQIENDLLLHLQRQDLPCMLTSDLLIRNVPLKEGVSPDIAIWPGRHVLAPGVEYSSVELSEDMCPSLILEIASESTVEADRDIKYEIYRLAGVSEYWLYDPMGYTGGSPFMGWRLADTVYEPLEGWHGTVADQATMLYPSGVLKTVWGLEHETELRLLDPILDDWYRMTPKALEQERTRADQAEAQARQERIRADQAEIQAQREKEFLQRELLRLKGLLDEHADRD